MSLLLEYNNTRVYFKEKIQVFVPLSTQIYLLLLCRLCCCSDNYTWLFLGVECPLGRVNFTNKVSQ